MLKNWDEAAYRKQFRKLKRESRHARLQRLVDEARREAVSRPTEQFVQWAIQQFVDIDFWMSCPDRPPHPAKTHQCEHCKCDKLNSQFTLIFETWGPHYGWWCDDCYSTWGGKWGVARTAEKSKERRGRKRKHAA
jgi:hypothetical protein